MANKASALDPLLETMRREATLANRNPDDIQITTIAPRNSGDVNQLVELGVQRLVLPPTGLEDTFEQMERRWERFLDRMSSCRA